MRFVGYPSEHILFSIRLGLSHTTPCSTFDPWLCP